jgi:hypothetical protein
LTCKSNQAIGVKRKGGIAITTHNLNNKRKKKEEEEEEEDFRAFFASLQPSPFSLSLSLSLSLSFIIKQPP